MTKDQMIPCPKGCGVSVHPDNVGFHVCRTSKDVLQQAIDLLYECRDGLAAERGDKTNTLYDKVWRWLQANRSSAHETSQPIASWRLTDEHINSLQVESVDRLIKRAKAAHYVNVRVRINGDWEEHEADWIKYMKREPSLHQACLDSDVVEATKLHGPPLTEIPSPEEPRETSAPCRQCRRCISRGANYCSNCGISDPTGPIRPEEPSCFHTLVMPESTLTVIDPFKAKCRVCYEFFDLPLDGPQSPEKASALPPGSCTNCGDTGFIRVEGRTENCKVCNR